MKTITILGGTSGFGKWIVGFIKDNFHENINIIITGTDKTKGDLLSKELGCIFMNDNVNAVKNADYVILSVPISITEKVIQQIAPFLKKGTVILDVTSVKIIPTKAMYENCHNSLIIPTHPMFGPFVKKIVGQVIVLTPNQETKKKPEYIIFKNFLIEKGAKIIETSPEIHDEYMSVIQGLTHYSLFVMAETIRRLNFNIEFSQNFVSPVYKLIISTIARYMNQNPYLYSQIQINNPLNIKVHNIFIQVANDFKNYIEVGYEKGLVDILNKTSQYFGKEAQKGQQYTDKIIYLLGKQTELLNNSIGKKIKLENIYSKNKLEGILEKIGNDEIIIDGKNYNKDEWYVI